ncbi:type II secretion system minor pseudopilin GspK [Acidiferrobacter sp.]|uniref:type II secretion system minor pseudopilin GspK n=1 Tax=Acidiferrobacter sp. TaxID=1872107 RepID=UPI002624DAE3|nr:type II secretion system minor pseudopilin GspK [Acidiferrobacter sp.]
MTGERGLALIMALLVVALVAAIAGALMRGESVWLTETADIRAQAQAQAAIDGVLRVAAVLVTAQGRRDRIDDRAERWAGRWPPWPVAGGTVRARLIDPQGRFNLNDLVVAGRVVPAALAVFARLLRLAGLNPGLARAVAAWEIPPGWPGGRIDAVYGGRRTPYWAARAPLSRVSELSLVPGFSARVVRVLRPYIAALPRPTPINVDTAPSLVLCALCPGLTPEEARIVRREALRTPFASAAAFGEVLPRGVQPAYRAVTRTHYFLVRVTARFAGLVARRQGLLYRASRTQVTVIVWQEASWGHHRIPPARA